MRPVPFDARALLCPQALDKEVQRLSKLRNAANAEAAAGVDPKVIEAERQKLLDRQLRTEKMKEDYVAANIRRQVRVATAPFTAPHHAPRHTPHSLCPRASRRPRPTPP